ncbi:MAG: hypothetical protein ABIP17_11620 [Ilumatobacteraceae bacterium]
MLAQPEHRLAGAAFAAAIVVATVVFAIVGRNQWFILDDWSVLITRRRIGVVDGAMHEYFVGQDGHWMTVPVMLYRAIEALFGLGSYWPFLVPVLIAHVASVVLLRVVCRRVGASPWTSTLVCSIVLVLGSGWENIVFAVQITYNLTLLAFLAQLLLVDHDGHVDRRDVAGSVLAIIGTASSGFGPFFVFGIALLLVLRRRWLAAAVGVVPSALAYVWWWISYGGDAAADRAGRPFGRLPAFVRLGVDSTLQALVPLASLTGIVAFGVVAVLLLRRRDPGSHDIIVAMAATMMLMFIGVGVERIGLSIDIAASSRYVYMAVFLIVPSFALAIDELRRLGREFLIAGWILLAATTAVQSGLLVINGSDRAALAQAERRQLSLIAGAQLPDDFDQLQACVELSVDIRCNQVAILVEKGAIEPLQPVDDADRAFVAGLADGIVATDG